MPLLFTLTPPKDRRRAAASLLLAVRAAGLPVPLTEYVFAPGRRWRFDYAWPAFMVALEIEGGTFGRAITVDAGSVRKGGRSVPLAAGTRVRVGGRHNSGAGLEADAHKYNRAAILGWLLIRATTRMVDNGDALDALRAAFAARGLE